MVWSCIRPTCLTLICEVTRYRQNLSHLPGGQHGITFLLSRSRPLSFSSLTYSLSFSKQKTKTKSVCEHSGVIVMDLMHHWQPCFRTVSAILIVLSTVVAKDAISSFHVQSDPSTDSLSSISLLGWLKTCPEDLAKHAGAFLLMAAR